MAVHLVMANKAYSSWSVRPWLVMAVFKIPFEETVIALDRPDTRKKILRHTPSGKCPTLKDGDVHVWDSLAIVEYLAEKHPRKAIWPKDPSARALARSISAEMHSGFPALRRECPMNLRRPVRAIALSEEAQADAKRIDSIWASTRKAHGEGGPFLFGAFSAADAMYAPVVNRFNIYGVKASKASRDYMAAVMALPAWRALVKDAEAEPWRIEKYEAI